MTPDIDAIRLQHMHYGGYLTDDCCSLGVALHALDAMTTERNGWADTAAEYASERDAALAREEALLTILDQVREVLTADEAEVVSLALAAHKEARR